MITVMELLSHPLFRNFSLASDSSGLFNAVTGTAIFDWESKEDIEATFQQGEFVMTTLSIAKDNVTNAEEYLRILIEKKVAAIAIKTIHHHHFSIEIIEFANSHRVPIFFFFDTFIDDLIYTIKNALITGELNVSALKKIKNILNSENEIKVQAKELNPFFYENCICCCCIPKNSKKSKEILDNYYTFYHQLPHSQLCDINTAHSIIKGNKVIIIIFTSSLENERLQKALQSFLFGVGLTEKKFRIGVSNYKNDLSLLGFAINEAIFSAMTCVMDNEILLEFKNIGINQLLMPIYKSVWTYNYHNNYYMRLAQYDKEHNSNLQETLLQYIKSGGDILLTADRLFQHNNTIRYRLGKIKDILEINNASDTDIQIYIYARLTEIYRTFKEDDLL